MKSDFKLPPKLLRKYQKGILASEYMRGVLIGLEMGIEQYPKIKGGKR